LILTCHAIPRDLLSFPTRRSSDLGILVYTVTSGLRIRLTPLSKFPYVTTVILVNNGLILTKPGNIDSQEHFIFHKGSDLCGNSLVDRVVANQQVRAVKRELR